MVKQKEELTGWQIAEQFAALSISVGQIGFGLALTYCSAGTLASVGGGLISSGVSSGSYTAEKMWNLEPISKTEYAKKVTRSAASALVTGNLDKLSGVASKAAEWMPGASSLVSKASNVVNGITKAANAVPGVNKLAKAGSAATDYARKSSVTLATKAAEVPGVSGVAKAASVATEYAKENSISLAKGAAKMADTEVARQAGQYASCAAKGEVMGGAGTVVHGVVDAAVESAVPASKVKASKKIENRRALLYIRQIKGTETRPWDGSRCLGFT